MSWGRVRIPVVWLCLLAMLLAGVTDFIPDWAGLAALVVGMSLYLRLGWPRRREPVAVAAPVVGRWRALNSPADRVPSHGLHAYGQTFAIDLVGEPVGPSRPSWGWWPLARRPAEFPGFGASVVAPAPGVVVEAEDRARDHWSRKSYPALLYLLLESVMRELSGPGRLLGNRVVIETGDGLYVVLAHLRRGSIRVEPGDVVATGDHLADCGNSGNSTEPHVHFQLMDHASVLLADGVPFSFYDRGPLGQPRRLGVPSRNAPFVAEVPGATRAWRDCRADQTPRGLDPGRPPPKAPLATRAGGEPVDDGVEGPAERALPVQGRAGGRGGNMRETLQHRARRGPMLRRSCGRRAGKPRART